MRQWADGSQYTGQFLDGEMHGAGHLIRADGERYEGGWKRNQRCGQGVLVAPDGSRYEGAWEEHRLNGHGTLEVRRSSLSRFLLIISPLPCRLHPVDSC